ncbi:MAG: hypothetical protein BWY57_00811 [Betaproteobacteria bacterium ADurb.Bin341]|nr:MAG: hypothetical protein BWY57_00811 [Betaproteobacteria bacterium ADurb.Bin341]
MSENKVIHYDSSEAASIKTVTGWVSSCGRFWGDDEHMARYDGCTHVSCKKCGTSIPVRGVAICDACRAVIDAEKWAAMPLAEWNGTDPLYSEVIDQYTSDVGQINDYCAENGISIEDLRLVICTPNFANEIDANEHFCDDLPEDSEVPADLEAAVNALNAVIRSMRESAVALSWSPGKFRPTVESLGLGGTT